MKTTIAGLILGMGMSLAAQAETFHFTPILDTDNPEAAAVALALGNQLTMEVTAGANNTALFTFSNDANGGDIYSVISKVVFDDSPSNLFSDISIANQGGDVSFREGGTPVLPGTANPTYSFTGTDTFTANHPYAFRGINNPTASGGEFLTLSATLNGGRTFTDVINSLNAGDETDPNFLRVGLRVTSVDALEDMGECNLSYLDNSNGGATPPPIPEPETYSMLLAGLGLMTVIARRRQQQRG